MDKILKRLLIEGVGCLLFGIIFLVNALLNKGSWYEYLLIVGLYYQVVYLYIKVLL